MLPLLSLRLLVVLVVAAVGCIVASGVLLVRRQGRRRLPLVSASVVVGLVLGAGAAGAGINRHFVLYRSWRSLFGLYSRDLVAAHSPAALARALAPLPAGVPARTHGQLLSLRIPGTTSGLAAGTSLVYLPPQYGSSAWASRGFPVVEAIPGSPGAPDDYVNGVRADAQLDAAIRAHRLPPVIVVFPPSNLSVLRSLECVDTADGLRDETYLTTDVRSWVSSHLDAAPGRWTVMGYSTGGYCALDLSLRHPDLYARAVSLDGYAHALDDHYARGLWPPGYDGLLARLEHSPDWWVAHRAPEPVAVYLSAGTRDRDAASDAVRFWELLGANGWRAPADRLVAERHAGHTFAGWEQAFVPALRWALAGDAGDGAAGDALARAELQAAARVHCPSTSSGGPVPTPAPGSSACPRSVVASPSPSPAMTPKPSPTATRRPRATSAPTATARASASAPPAVPSPSASTSP